jgi:O-acetylhomoserine (thiol)-lyase
MKPFEHGADLLFHSATKFLSGHGTVIGGVLVDSGAFDWAAAHARHGGFAELAQPYDGFHGMVFAEESTVGAFLLRARREGLRDFGACMSPHTAWLILQGIETLPLRMARHVENTRKVVAVPSPARRWSSASATPSSRRTRPRARHAPAAARLRLGVQLRPARLARQGIAFIEALKLLLAPGQRRRLPLAR